MKYKAGDNFKCIKELIMGRRHFHVNAFYTASHECADNLEFCQGFNFDYHFCKVCGTKHNVA